MRVPRAILLLGLILSATALAPSAADATAVFRYSVSLDDGVYSTPAGGTISISGLDTTKTTRVIVSPPTGSNRYDSGTVPSGSGYFSPPPVTSLSPGDTVFVRQPATSVGPTDTLPIPNFALNLAVGSNVITGTMPEGLLAAVSREFRCGDQAVPSSPPAGPFSIPSTPILPGEVAQLYGANATGDSFAYLRHAPGESPCVFVDGFEPEPPPTGATEPTPYSIDVENLNADVAASVRVVLRRGATVLADGNSDGLNFSQALATRPLPGDTVDIYRPKTAPAPLYTRTIPTVSSVFDPSVDLVAVSAPPASQLEVEAQRAFDRPTTNVRARIDLPAGRSFFDFASAQGRSGPFDLRPDDRIGVHYRNTDGTMFYSFPSVPGDLVAPTQSFRLPSKLKRSTLVKAFKKGYKLQLNSSELAVAKLTLAFPAATRSAKSKAKAKAKAVTLASAKPTLRNGTTSVRLKFTKSGKKALKKLAKGTSRTAVLTSTATDPSGNASTVVKKTKIKA